MYYLIILPCILLSWAILRHLFSHLSGKIKLPPGPSLLPIVGNIFQLGTTPHKSLAELAKVHGPVMSLQLGYLRTIVISSAPVAEEVLKKKDSLFCNRNIPDSLIACQHHALSVALLPVSAQWRSLRKACNSHVFSSARMDSTQYLRRKKLADLISYVGSCSRSGDAVDIGHATFNTSLNLLSNTFFSVDLADPNSSKSHEFKELVWQIMVEAGKPNLSDFFPLLKRFDLLGNRHRLEAHFSKMINLFETLICQRLAEKGGCLDECNDALDSLLKISQNSSEELPLTFIPHLLLDLFVAGSETTSSTVEWAMAELFCNPDKMKKAQEELKSVVGKGIPVEEDDTPRLPYLQSVIKETLRMHPPIPFLVPRKTDFDVELCGFTVPKDSQVFVNVWAIGRDPNLWENPTTFEPERFVGIKIDVKGQDFELIPFGAGRRICPGLPLAMRMLPLMLGSLLNCFDWRLEDGVTAQSIDMNDNFGFTVQKAQSLRAIPINI